MKHWTCKVFGHKYTAYRAVIFSHVFYCTKCGKVIEIKPKIQGKSPSQVFIDEFIFNRSEDVKKKILNCAKTESEV